MAALQKLPWAENSALQYYKSELKRLWPKELSHAMASAGSMEGLRMQTEGLEIADIDGRYPDNWCNARVAGRVIATQPGRAFTVTCWTPKDPLSPSSIITVRLDRVETFKFLVPSGGVHACRTPVFAEPGTEISFEIECTNRLMASPNDLRQLSFVLSSIGIYE